MIDVVAANLCFDLIKASRNLEKQTLFSASSWERVLAPRVKAKTKNKTRAVLVVWCGPCGEKE